jgi:hypothetical protein
MDDYDITIADEDCDGVFDYDDYDDYDDEPSDGFRDDVEADADVLRSCGWGTDEDYGGYDQGDW